MPRLLAFYQDAWDDDGTPVGWRTIAWGLGLGDGSAVTVAGRQRGPVGLSRHPPATGHEGQAPGRAPSPRCDRERRRE